METYKSKFQAFLFELDRDSEYMDLQESFAEAQESLQGIISTLELTQQDALCQYLGVLAEMHMREVELALMLEQRTEF